MSEFLHLAVAEIPHFWQVHSNINACLPGRRGRFSEVNPRKLQVPERRYSYGVRQLHCEKCTFLKLKSLKCELREWMNGRGFDPSRCRRILWRMSSSNPFVKLSNCWAEFEKIVTFFSAFVCIFNFYKMTMHYSFD